MVGVGDVSREVVEFGAADGTDGGAGEGGGLEGVDAVAGGGFEGAEAGAEGDVQEGLGGEGEEFVVGAEELRCEDFVAGGAVHCLRWKGLC